MRLQIVAAVLATCLVAGPIQPRAGAQGGSSANKKPDQNAVKGQGQLSGIYAQFGTTYTLKNNFNFTLLSAQYTMSPFNCYGLLAAQRDQKLIILDIAIKNVAKTDNTLNGDGFITLVDEKGQLYGTSTNTLSLKSMGPKVPGNLKPGQGFGQPSLHDPLQIGRVLPANARIVKIIVNIGRLGNSEKVMRYNIAGATQEEAGAPGDPKNVIASLPDNVRDPADKSGAVALSATTGKIGEYLPARAWGLRLDGVAVSTDKYNSQDAPVGKKYVVATVTAKILAGSAGDSAVPPWLDDAIALTDSDGERYRATGQRKAKRDEQPAHDFMDDEYTYRIFFTVPNDVTLKTLTLATNASPWLKYDVSGVK